MGKAKQLENLVGIEKQLMQENSVIDLLFDKNKVKEYTNNG